MTDEDLSRFHAGDAAFFRQLVNELSPRLLSAALHVTRESVAAHDLVHDTWVQAFQARHTFNGRGSILGWLLAIMRTCHVAALRSESRHTARASAYAGSSDTASTESASIDDAIDEVESRARLLDGIMQLPVRQRDVLVCRVLEECTVAETAQRLGIAEGTVKATLSQAIRRLRTLLRDT